MTKARQLQWRDYVDGDYLSSVTTTPVGRFEVWRLHERAKYVCEGPDIGGSEAASFETLEEAKTHLQARFNKIVLSLLEPSAPAVRCDRILPALQELADACEGEVEEVFAGEIGLALLKARFVLADRLEPVSGIDKDALLAAVKEWGRWHHLNEVTVAAKKTPSDSEIDFEVEAWRTIEKLLSSSAAAGQA